MVKITTGKTPDTRKTTKITTGITIDTLKTPDFTTRKSRNAGVKYLTSEA